MNNLEEQLIDLYRRRSGGGEETETYRMAAELATIAVAYKWQLDEQDTNILRVSLRTMENLYPLSNEPIVL